MAEADYSHAESELTATPWLAHLAGGSCAAALLLAWVLLVLVAPGYLDPLMEQDVMLSIPAQVALQATLALRGAAGGIGLVAGLGLTLFLWLRARKSGGANTLLLFSLAVLLSIVAVGVVIACASPLHFVQDLPQQR